MGRTQSETSRRGISARSAPLARAAAALQHQLEASDSALAHPAWIGAREQVLAAHAAGARLVVLVGGRGAGKTRMLHDLAAALRAAGNKTQLWRPLRADVDPAFHGVALIDDAERLDLTLFEEIRGAENFSAILAGNWPPDWLGAIAATLPVVLLPPLGRRELRRLVAASISKAKLPLGAFKPRVIDSLHAWSGGSARQATALAAASLASAAVAGTDRLTVQQVDQVAIELGLERRLPPPERSATMSRLLPAAMGGLAAAVVAAVGIEAFQDGSIGRSAARAREVLIANQLTASPSPDSAPISAPTAATQPASDVTAAVPETAAPTDIPAATPVSPSIVEASPEQPAAAPAAVEASAAPVAQSTPLPVSVDAVTPPESGEHALAKGERRPAAPDSPPSSITAVEPAPPAPPTDPASAPTPEQAVRDSVQVAALPPDPLLAPRSSSEPPAVSGETVGIIVRPDLSTATTRVAVSYGDGDPAAARTARVLAQMLRAGGYLVEDPVAVHGRTVSPGVHYYFAEDADAASRLARQVSTVTADATTQRSPTHQPWPRPGTVEIVVPARLSTPR